MADITDLLTHLRNILLCLLTRNWTLPVVIVLIVIIVAALPTGLIARL